MKYAWTEMTAGFSLTKDAFEAVLRLCYSKYEGSWYSFHSYSDDG